MARSTLHTLLSLREREADAQKAKLAAANASSEEAEGARIEAERARAAHRADVERTMRNFDEEMDRGGCTAGDLERLATYRLGAELEDRAHGAAVAERNTRLEAADAAAETARGGMARACVAVRVIEKRIDVEKRDCERALETRREEDP